jgi:hypothetical protein
MVPNKLLRKPPASNVPIKSQRNQAKSQNFSSKAKIFCAGRFLINSLFLQAILTGFRRSPPWSKGYPLPQRTRLSIDRANPYKVLTQPDTELHGRLNSGQKAGQTTYSS